MTYLSSMWFAMFVGFVFGGLFVLLLLSSAECRRTREGKEVIKRAFDEAERAGYEAGRKAGNKVFDDGESINWFSNWNE